MPTYLLITSTGVYAPKYEHYSMESAETEAKRLCIAYDCSVKIVEIVSVVCKRPVYEVVTKSFAQWLHETNARKVNDELPF